MRSARALLLLFAACGGDAPEPAAAAAGAPVVQAGGLQSYTETIAGTDLSFAMIAIPGGTFWIGSEPDEPGHAPDEAPRRRVDVEPFWLGRCEVRWDEYDVWSQERDAGDPRVDGVARPTPPYTDMTFGMGREGFPAVCMTQHAAATYCEWLSRKTGRKYRLPSEAEWEWACRAGTTTAHSCSGPLADHAWFLDNSGGSYQKVGTKLPNPWGLHDMHGNVAEWTAEQYVPQRYAEPAADARWPLRLPVKEYPITVRGGSFLDGPLALRSAARRGSHPDWKQRDPQIPKSIWYMTDARFVGFRVLREPER